ncbi:hypothetical protein PN472_14620 [Microcystis aeruginosa CS-1036]|nr:hypothetical protein [Microcystis sp. CS-574]MDB9544359.1 hypothetical protein [Microcystis aeruginosa CS-1036]
MIALLPKMIAAPSQKTIAFSHPQKAITLIPKKQPHSQTAIALSIKSRLS